MIHPLEQIRQRLAEAREAPWVEYANGDAYQGDPIDEQLAADVEHLLAIAEAARELTISHDITKDDWTVTIGNFDKVRAALAALDTHHAPTRC